MAKRFFHSDRASGNPRLVAGTLQHVAVASFCDIAACHRPASWRIESTGRSVVFCTKHTVLTMRMRHPWVY